MSIATKALNEKDRSSCISLAKSFNEQFGIKPQFKKEMDGDEMASVLREWIDGLFNDEVFQKKVEKAARTKSGVKNEIVEAFEIVASEDENADLGDTDADDELFEDEEENLVDELDSVLDEDVDAEEDDEDDEDDEADEDDEEEEDDEDDEADEDDEEEEEEEEEADEEEEEAPKKPVMKNKRAKKDEPVPATVDEDGESVCCNLGGTAKSLSEAVSTALLALSTALQSNTRITMSITVQPAATIEGATALKPFVHLPKRTTTSAEEPVAPNEKDAKGVEKETTPENKKAEKKTRGKNAKAVPDDANLPETFEEFADTLRTRKAIVDWVRAHGKTKVKDKHVSTMNKAEALRIARRIFATLKGAKS